MTLPNITQDCPDAHAELFRHAKTEQAKRQFVETNRLPVQDKCPERNFALGCIGLAALAIVFVVFILPFLFR